MSQYYMLLCLSCGDVFHSSVYEHTIRNIPEGLCPNCRHEHLMELCTAEEWKQKQKEGTWERYKEDMRRKYIVKDSPMFDAEAYRKREERDQAVKMNPNFNSAARVHVPRCPTCGSASVNNRGQSGGTIFHRMAHKQFHCNNCGYEW